MAKKKKRRWYDKKRYSLIDIIFITAISHFIYGIFKHHF